MKITHNGKTIDVLTIKELYEAAKILDQEDAILAVNINLEHIDKNDDTCYCEQVNAEDITLALRFRPFGWEVAEHTYHAFEINSHMADQKTPI